MNYFEFMAVSQKAAEIVPDQESEKRFLMNVVVAFGLAAVVSTENSMAAIAIGISGALMVYNIGKQSFNRELSAGSNQPTDSVNSYRRSKGSEPV